MKSEGWTTSARAGLNKQEILGVVRDSLDEVGTLLPTLPSHVEVRLHASKSMAVPEVGVGGFTFDAHHMALYVDPTLPYGVEAMIKALRGTTFHEGAHAARMNVIQSGATGTDIAIFEGLATITERDFGGLTTPWSHYEDDRTMRRWMNELAAIDELDTDYLYTHPDGRRWVAYRTGAWVVDNVMATHSISLAELTAVPANEIVDLLPRSQAVS